MQGKQLFPLGTRLTTLPRILFSELPIGSLTFVSHSERYDEDYTTDDESLWIKVTNTGVSNVLAIEEGRIAVGGQVTAAQYQRLICVPPLEVVPLK